MPSDDYDDIMECNCDGRPTILSGYLLTELLELLSMLPGVETLQQLMQIHQDFRLTQFLHVLYAWNDAGCQVVVQQ